jgi:hypothetical protein
MQRYEKRKEKEKEKKVVGRIEYTINLYFTFYKVFNHIMKPSSCLWTG